jgi:hypothetical protein
MGGGGFGQHVSRDNAVSSPCPHGKTGARALYTQDLKSGDGQGQSGCEK